MPHTVIDGYNLLLRELHPASSSLADVREEFLRRVDAARPPDHDVTVVFDGRPGPGARALRAAGLDVRYSASPRTADDLIVKLVKKFRGRQITVLTHDRELARRAKAEGARIGDPAEFFRPPRRRSSSPPSNRGGKPRAPRGDEIDDWERLFRERPRGDDT